MSHMDNRSGQYRYVGNEEYRKMPFSVDMAGVDKCTPKYFLRRQDSQISVVGYTLKGCGVIVQDGKRVEAGEGSLFVVNIGGNHEYYPLGDWEFCWVNIRGRYWHEYLQQYGLDREIVFENFELGREFLRLVDAVTCNMEDLDVWQIEIQSLLMKSLLFLYKTRNFHDKKSLAFQIRMMFERNIARGKTQEEIAKEIGITARHAQRIFKEEYKISIHQFLEMKKLQQAKALLVNTNSTIKQIAEHVGFDNEKYFSVFFHKKVGVSPRDYRDTYWQKNTPNL